jgi:hypothetical protein
MGFRSDTDRFAFKRLSAVEVDPERSHQHEFHAGIIRKTLGLPPERTSGRLLVAYFNDDEEPLFETGSYTLTNVRLGKPRAAEYHMYYISSVIDDAAEPGDLLVISRRVNGSDIRAVIARAGSRAETEILDAILARDEPVLERFQAADPPAPSADRAERLFATFAPAEAAADFDTYPLVQEAFRSGNLPGTRAMAEAGREIAGVGDARSDPDGFMDGALNAETRLFNHITEQLGRRGLNQLIERHAPFSDFQALFMSMNQAAKSRRGLSLQYHFASVLETTKILFSPQCPTETGETADFVMPGCVRYHDPNFPAERLRMVACKSTARDRWRQVLNEASRIEQKYFLTLDPDLTPRLIAKIWAADLRLFLPQSLISAHYPSEPRVGSLVDLIEALEDAAMPL